MWPNIVMDCNGRYGKPQTALARTQGGVYRLPARKTGSIAFVSLATSCTTPLDSRMILAASGRTLLGLCSRAGGDRDALGTSRVADFLLGRTPGFWQIGLQRHSCWNGNQGRELSQTLSFR
jgi:hypothetical protein